MLRRGGLLMGVLLAVGCSGGSGAGKAVADRSALLFGLDTGDATLLGTQPIDSLQITNTGDGDVTISGTSIVAASSFTTVPVGTTPGRAADVAHPDFFATTPASQATLKPNETAVVQVTFKPALVGLWAATLSVVTSAGTLSIPVAGDCVTPLLQVGPGQLQEPVELPQVALKRKAADLPDGGPAYTTGYAVGTLALFDVGTADLNFQPVELVGDGGVGSPITLCDPTAPLGAVCDTLPVPSHLPRTYADGGVAVRHLPDGGTQQASAVVSVYFAPVQPGDYTQTLRIQSDATNTPDLTVRVHGLATPDGG